VPAASGGSGGRPVQEKADSKATPSSRATPPYLLEDEDWRELRVRLGVVLRGAGQAARRARDEEQPQPEERRPVPRQDAHQLRIEVFAEEAERHEAAGSRERSDHTDTARVISISTLRGRRLPLLHLLPIHGAVATDRPVPHPIPSQERLQSLSPVRPPCGRGTSPSASHVLLLLFNLLTPLLGSRPLLNADGSAHHINTNPKPSRLFSPESCYL
jgi:hypothetical protein